MLANMTRVKWPTWCGVGLEQTGFWCLLLPYVPFIHCNMSLNTSQPNMTLRYASALLLSLLSNTVLADINNIITSHASPRELVYTDLFAPNTPGLQTAGYKVLVGKTGIKRLDVPGRVEVCVHICSSLLIPSISNQY